MRQERLIPRNPMRGIHLPALVKLPRPLPSDHLASLLDRVPSPVGRLLIALLCVHALIPGQAASLRLEQIEPARHRIRLPHRTLYLDTLTTALLTDWLRTRQNTWPTTTNPHLLLTPQTALAPHHPTVSPGWIVSILAPTGLNATQLRQDRLLDEARHTADPVHLMHLFGITPGTALRYIHAAHPEQTSKPPR
ncbi:hypothetical protein [Streptomyces sp. NPDC000410]|uniref:hypothetical protein n=1 Tax=Streptomyces sp. NPDC000410 TaxID=3154254 RepID=UPI0033322DE4